MTICENEFVNFEMSNLGIKILLLRIENTCEVYGETRSRHNLIEVVLMQFMSDLSHLSGKYAHRCSMPMANSIQFNWSKWPTTLRLHVYHNMSLLWDAYSSFIFIVIMSLSTMMSRCQQPKDIQQPKDKERQTKSKCVKCPIHGLFLIIRKRKSRS